MNNSHSDKTSTASETTEVAGEVNVRSRPSHSRSSSMYASANNPLTSSGAMDTFNISSDSPISQSTEGLGSSVLRRKTKSTRLSFPSALNSASDKLFGKRRSSESIKSKTSSASDKGDKLALKERFGLKKSSSKEKSKELSRSFEVGLDSSGLADAESSAEKMDDSPVGSVVFKPRYTPPEEKKLDLWLTGTANAPLAREEGDSPVEPPTRSFPLCSTSLPHHVHRDMYDTALALTSLRGDGCDSGLEYLNKVHSVANTAYISSANQSSSQADVPLEGKT